MAANPDTVVDDVPLVEAQQAEPHGPVDSPAPALPPPPSRLERLVMRFWTSPFWLAPLGIALCVTAALGYVVSNNPADNKADPLGPCTFKALTGFDCPGCGGTRMVWFALQGDVLQAARHHLVAFIAVPVLLYMYVSWCWNRFRKKESLPLLRVSGWVVGAYFGSWLVYSVLRNLPLEPFNWFYVS